jgi:Pyruvate/2-oxoacid:ferredoxin oxidoreductase gamma subunit
MKNPIIYLLVISFLLHSCYTYKAVDLKSTYLIVGEQIKITQEDKTEIGNFVALNDSLLYVSVDKTKKDISISNIKKIEKQQPTMTTMIGLGLLVGAIWLTLELLDLNQNE